MNNKRIKIKRKMFFASQYEIEAIENFLEQEAANGWMFVRCSGLFYVFEECTPVRLKFHVDYLGMNTNSDTNSDTNPESKKLDEIEYCNESEWYLGFSSGKLRIFYSNNENPIPIQTDENMKLKLASKATILENWNKWILLPFLLGVSHARFALWGLSDPISYYLYSIYLTGFGGIGILIFCLLLTILGIVNLLRLGIFYFKNKIRLKNGLNIEYYSSKNVKRFGAFQKICLLLIIIDFAAFSMNNILPWGSFFLMIFGIIAMIFFINKIKYSNSENRKINRMITIVVLIVLANVIIIGAVFTIIGKHDSKITLGNKTYYYSKDSIDVTLADLGVDKTDSFLYEETSHKTAGSFLATKESYSDHYNEKDKSYGYSIDIFSSKFESIMNKYNELIMEDAIYDMKQLADSKDTWNSDNVFYGKYKYDSMYAVIGDGVTIVIKGELNEEQAAKLSTYYINKQTENNK